MKVINKDIFESNADIILHQVNCKGVMGIGIARQIRDRFPQVYIQYKNMCDSFKGTGRSSDLLGRADFVRLDNENIGWVGNLFAQDGYGHDKCYTDYHALRMCMRKVNQKFAGMNVAIPYRIGCGLGGGDWEVVLNIIEEELVDCNVTLYRYNVQERKF